MQTASINTAQRGEGCDLQSFRTRDARCNSVMQVARSISLVTWLGAIRTVRVWSPSFLRRRHSRERTGQRAIVGRLVTRFVTRDKAKAT